MLLIGSQAAKIHGVGLVRRTDAHEWDVIGRMNDLCQFADWDQRESSEHPGKLRLVRNRDVVEFDATGNASNSLLLEELSPGNHVISPTHDVLGVGMQVAGPLVLHTIKRSHAVSPINFEKTLRDMVDLENHLGRSDLVAIRRQSHLHSELLRLRQTETRERIARKNRVRLDRSNEEFFKNGQDLRVHEHDDLHRAVARFPDFPMFLRCKWDWESAKIDRDLFERLDPRMQRWMAMEESMVIALERFLIPSDFKMCPRVAYRRGLFKVIRDLSRGWFQEFCLDNLRGLLEPQWDYVDNFNQALAKGRIREVTP